jgi:hypothetical protein
MRPPGGDYMPGSFCRGSSKRRSSQGFYVRSAIPEHIGEPTLVEVPYRSEELARGVEEVESRKPTGWLVSQESTGRMARNTGVMALLESAKLR